MLHTEFKCVLGDKLKSTVSLAVSMIAVLVLFSSEAVGQRENAVTSIHLRDLGNFWTGGVWKENANGTESVTGQTYVEFFLPAEPLENSPPIILVPGGGLTGTIYGTTPDGRRGWAHYLASQGFDVYVTEPFGRGRAGSGPWESSAWVLWDMGDTGGELCGNCAFPEGEDAYKMWMSQFEGPAVASAGGVRAGGIGGGRGGVPTANADDVLVASDGTSNQHRGLVELLEHTGPAVLIAHSAGGGASLSVSAGYPDLVEALITVEPSGCPGNGGEQLADVPYMNLLGEYGNLETHANCMALAAQSLQAGGKGGAGRYLPEYNLYGHGHLLMQERGSDEIADLMVDWIMGGYPNEL